RNETVTFWADSLGRPRWTVMVLGMTTVDRTRGDAAGPVGAAAAPLPVKEGVGRDDDRRRRLGEAGVGGAQLPGGQGGLARKDLDPFDADRLAAGLLGRQDADGVGAGLGVVLVQGQAGGRGVDLDVGGGAVRPGHPADGKTVP